MTVWRRKDMNKLTAGILSVLTVMTLVFSAACGAAGAELKGRKVDLSGKEAWWSVIYPTGEDFKLEKETTEWGDRIRVYRVADLDFWVSIAEKPINLSWQPLEDEIGAIESDGNTSSFERGVRKYSGRDRDWISYDTTDEEYGGRVTKHRCYFRYDRLGVRYYYCVEFINCSKDTAAFEEAFLKQVKTAK